MDLKEFERWKRKIEGLQRKADRVSGVLDEVTRRLKQEFNCSSPQEALEFLDQLVEEHKALSRELAGEMEDFKKKWGNKLEG